MAPIERPLGQVHVLGAGPVGLFLTALLQSIDGPRVRLYERRAGYERTRMVSLADYLVADSIESYKADTIDGSSVEAIFDADRARDPAGLPANNRRGPARAAARVDTWVRSLEHDRALAERAD